MRSVRNLHAGQGTDQALIFKDGLQRSLADLRLVGGVGRVVLTPANNLIDCCRYEVVVRTGAKKDTVLAVMGIGFTQPIEFGHQLRLRQRWWQFERRKAMTGRNINEEVFNCFNTDCL